MRKILLICFLSIVLCACGTPVAKNNPSSPARGESFYVFGLKPANYKVQIYPGSLSADGTFKLNQFLSATFNSVADQGYAVGKSKAGSVLAITRVFVKEEGRFLDPSFVPCGDANTVVFTAAEGQVAYLGDIEYLFNGSNLEIRRSNNIEDARKYLEENYPKLAPLLQQGEPRLAKTNLPCSSTIYVPVYLPR